MPATNHTQSILFIIISLLLKKIFHVAKNLETIVSQYLDIILGPPTTVTKKDFPEAASLWHATF